MPIPVMLPVIHELSKLIYGTNNKSSVVSNLSFSYEQIYRDCRSTYYYHYLMN